MIRHAFVLFACACGTTIHASDYASDCDADLQCAVIEVGDICSCSCNLAAINDRDFDKYANDVERIGGCRQTCTTDDAGVFACGATTGARCSSGVCVTYALPADASAE